MVHNLVPGEWNITDWAQEETIIIIMLKPWTHTTDSSYNSYLP